MCKIHGAATGFKPTGDAGGCVDCWMEWMSLADEAATFTLKELFYVLTMLRLESANKTLNVATELKGNIASVARSASDLAKVVQTLADKQNEPPRQERYDEIKSQVAAARRQCPHCGAEHWTKNSYCPTCTRNYPKGTR